MNSKSTATAITLIALLIASSRAADMPDMISTENMCGAVALACAARAAGATVDIGRLTEQLPLDGAMKSFADLEAAATKLGLATRVVRWRRDQPPRVPLPCIVRLVPNSPLVRPHFVILLAATPGAVHFFDPPNRAVWIAEEELFREWDGVALYVATDSGSLRTIAPTAPFSNLWIFFGAILMGAGLLGWVGWGLRSEHAGRSPVRQFRSGPLAASCVGWLVIAFGITQVSGTIRSPNRRSTILVESPSLDIPISEAALQEANGVVQGTFVLQNRGDHPAVITRIAPNCACTSATVSSNRIPAHGSTRIVANVTLQDTPSSEAKIVVELEDAIPQRLVLRIRARRIEEESR